MDPYPWVVFVHAAAVLLFFVAHGVSMFVALRVRDETNPERLRALLDLSRAAMGPVSTGLATLGLLAGIVAGFMGEWWGELWIWISLVLLLVVAFAMTPVMTIRLNAIRAAAGQANPRARDAPPPVEDLGLLRELQAGWNPLPLGAVAIAAFVVILYLMIVKPF